MGFALLLGGLAVLIAMAASSKGRTAAATPEARLREGTASPEDLEGAADVAEQRGMPEEAAAIRDRAEAQREETVTPVAVTPATVTPATVTPEERIRGGTASPEDLEGAADVAEQRGLDEEAAAIRDRAEAQREGEAPAPVITSITEERRPIPPPSAPRKPEEAAALPAEFNPLAAHGEARALANNIAATSYGYDRNLARNFQRHAGIAADGIYGPGTRGALIFFGISNAPRALFDPRNQQTTPYPSTLASAARAAFSAAKKR